MPKARGIEGESSGWWWPGSSSSRVYASAICWRQSPATTNLMIPRLCRHEAQRRTKKEAQAAALEKRPPGLQPGQAWSYCIACETSQVGSGQCKKCFPPATTGLGVASGSASSSHMPSPHLAKAPGYPRCPKCHTILDNGRCTECPAATKPPVLTYAMNAADCRTCDCGVREDALGKSQFRRHMKSCRVRSNEMQKKGTGVAAVAVCNSCGVPLVDGACDNCKAMDAWWTETLGDDSVDQSTSSKEPPCI